MFCVGACTLRLPHACASMRVQPWMQIAWGHRNSPRQAPRAHGTEPQSSPQHPPRPPERGCTNPSPHRPLGFQHGPSVGKSGHIQGVSYKVHGVATHSMPNSLRWLFCAALARQRLDGLAATACGIAICCQAAAHSEVGPLHLPSLEPAGGQSGRCRNPGTVSPPDQGVGHPSLSRTPLRRCLPLIWHVLAPVAVYSCMNVACKTCRSLCVCG